MTQVLDTLREAAATAFGDTPVVFAYLFGFQVTGRMHRRSDVDVAVFLREEAAGDFWLVIGELTRRLEDASDVRGIEMLDLSEAPLRLRGRVLQEGELLFSRDEPLRVEWSSRTFREFVDFERHARELDMASRLHRQMCTPHRSPVSRSCEVRTDRGYRGGDRRGRTHHRLRGFKTPETFAEVFVVLGDNGFLPKEGVEPLREMAAFETSWSMGMRLSTTAR
jgi:uncharacterized protein